MNLGWDIESVTEMQSIDRKAGRYYLMFTQLNQECEEEEYRSLDDQDYYATQLENLGETNEDAKEIARIISSW